MVNQTEPLGPTLASPPTLPKELPVKEERNLGVELLRIFAMFLIVMIHILGHGGVLSYSDHLSANYKAAWYLETLCYCAVNCYALISGFANVKTEFKTRRIIYLWLEVVALNLMMTFSLDFFFPGSIKTTKEVWAMVFFPLMTRPTWYFCAYFLLFPFIPLLNKGLRSIKKEQHLTLMVLMLMPTLFRIVTKSDAYALGSGYSAIWLIILYVVGAYFRLYGAPKWAKWYVTLPVFFLTAFGALQYKLSIEQQVVDGLLSSSSDTYADRGLFISYISPCMVVMAICLLLFFMQIKVKGKPVRAIVSALGKATFGVFILHVGTEFWNLSKFWSYFRKFADYSTPKMVGAVLLASLVVYLGLSLISLFQLYLFKFLGIHKLVDTIIDKVLHRKAKVTEPVPAAVLAETSTPIDTPSEVASSTEIAEAVEATEAVEECEKK